MAFNNYGSKKDEKVYSNEENSGNELTKQKFYSKFQTTLYYTWA